MNNTLHKYLESRKGLLITGKITVGQIYEGYRRFAEERDGWALSYEAVAPHLYSEICYIRLWWQGTTTFRNEQLLANFNFETGEIYGNTTVSDT